MALGRTLRGERVFDAVKNLLSTWRGVPAEPATDVSAPNEPSGEQQEDSVQRHFVSARQAFEAGHHEVAAADLKRAIELKHDFAEAHFLLGLAHMKLGYIEDATDCFTLAAHFKPDYAEAHLYLGMTATQEGRHAEAITSFERALAANEGYAEAYNGRGACWVAMGKLEAAIADFRRAVALNPEFAMAHSNLGHVLFRDLGEYEEGARHIETALRLSPGSADVLCNYSMVLSHQGRLEEMISLCDELLAARPNMQEVRLNRALALLKSGDYLRGWEGYKARMVVRSNFVPRGFPYPEWQGQELAGKTVLVYGEQGLGDEIMFASCLSDLIARAERCVIDCSPKLERLFRRSFAGVVVHGAPQTEHDTSWLSGMSPIDYQVAIGSLPLHFRRSGADFRRHSGYLTADPVRVENWRRRLAELDPGLKVGISWAGGMLSTRQSLRSTSLSDWLPIFRTEGCRFVSLQYGDRKLEVAALDREHGVTLHHWPQAIDDYDETAALVSALDLVISVQTAIVHLSGALGMPTWVMIAAAPEWRYLDRGETMPWYPSVRVWRQQTLGHWQGVIDHVTAELRRIAKS